MKKVLSLVLVLAMVLMFSAVASADAIPADQIKVGLILLHDENIGYDEIHLNGFMEMVKALGLTEEQYSIKYNVPETEVCYDKAIELVDEGCDIIFADSFGHESYMLQAAAEHPEVQFCHATGYQAKGSGLANMHNYFTAIYEARYVSGVVAGLKLNAMIADGTITEDTCKIGYVGAFPYAEVISGYTSFFLGVRSVCPSATMDVKFTNSWASFDLEKEAAEALVAQGCVLIAQHADTTGAPTACQALGVPCVGYNVSMNEVAPDSALTSSSNNWGIYNTYAVKSVIDGTPIDVDWCQGLAQGAVLITELNEKTVAEGTADKVAEVEAAIIDGSTHVFDTATFTVGGEKLEDLIASNADYAKYEAYVSDGYFHESELASAPAFDIAIDGITMLG